MRDFVSELLGAGDLAIVDRVVSPKFELAAVTRRVQQAGEQAVMFQEVGDTGIRVVSNLYGSHARLCRLIGAPDGDFCRRWSEIMEAPLPFPSATQRASSPPARAASCLSRLPAITYHAEDGGPYITSAIFLAKEPDTGVPNLSFHRSMMVGDDELRIRLGTRHDLTRYQAKAEERIKWLRGLGPLNQAILLVVLVCWHCLDCFGQKVGVGAVGGFGVLGVGEGVEVGRGLWREKV